LKTMTKKFIHHNQPYGTLVMEKATFKPIVAQAGSPPFVKVCAENGYGTVTGVITEGSTTDRILNHTATHSEVGKQHEVWAVTKGEWARGSKTTVAM